MDSRRIPQFACWLMALLLGLAAASFVAVSATEAAPVADPPWGPNVKVNDDAVGVAAEIFDRR